MAFAELIPGLGDNVFGFVCSGDSNSEKVVLIFPVISEVGSVVGSEIIGGRRCVGHDKSIAFVIDR